MSQPTVHRATDQNATSTLTKRTNPAPRRQRSASHLIEKENSRIRDADALLLDLKEETVQTCSPILASSPRRHRRRKSGSILSPGTCGVAMNLLAQQLSTPSKPSSSLATSSTILAPSGSPASPSHGRRRKSTARSEQTPLVVKDKHQERLEAGRRAIEELVATEKQFTITLGLIQRISFLTSEQKLLPEKEAELIFRNVDQLVATHSCLCAAWSRTLQEFNTMYRAAERMQDAITVVLDKLSDSFKGLFDELARNHGNYAIRYESGNTQLKESRTRNDGFSALLKTESAKPEMKNLDLSDLLIQPIQRVCRYKMLVERIYAELGMLSAQPASTSNAPPITPSFLRTAEKLAESVENIILDRRRREQHAQLEKIASATTAPKRLALPTEHNPFIKQFDVAMIFQGKHKISALKKKHTAAILFAADEARLPVVLQATMVVLGDYLLFTEPQPKPQKKSVGMALLAPIASARTHSEKSDASKKRRRKSLSRNANAVLTPLSSSTSSSRAAPSASTPSTPSGSTGAKVLCRLRLAALELHDSTTVDNCIELIERKHHLKGAVKQQVQVLFGSPSERKIVRDYLLKVLYKYNGSSQTPKAPRSPPISESVREPRGVPLLIEDAPPMTPSHSLAAMIASEHCETPKPLAGRAVASVKSPRSPRSPLSPGSPGSRLQRRASVMGLVYQVWKEGA